MIKKSRAKRKGNPSGARVVDPPHVPEAPPVTVPSPEIVIDRDDGDPPSSGHPSGTSARNEIPLADVRDGLGSSTWRPEHLSPLTSMPSPPPSGCLRPASWTLPTTSTPPRNNSNISVASHMAPTSPNVSLQSPVRLSESPRHRDDQSRHSGSKNSSKPRHRTTVEEVDDVDDPPHVISARAAKKQRVPATHSVSKNNHSSSRQSRSPEVDANKTRTHPSVSHASPIAPVSPYPAASILKEYDGPGMDDVDRAIRRNDKHRAAPVSKSPVNIPLPPSDPNMSDGASETVSLTHSAIRRMLDEAVARDRARRDDTSEARRRREKFVQDGRRMQEMRVNEDAEFAQNLDTQFAVEAADLEYAKRIHAQENEEQSFSLLEEQRDAAEAEEKARVAEETARSAREAARAHRLSVEKRRAEMQAKFIAHQQTLSAAAEAARQSNASDKGDAVEQSKLTVPPPVKTWKDRVILQRYRESELKSTGYSGVADQRVRWNAEGEPFELGPEVKENSSNIEVKPPNVREGYNVPAGGSKYKDSKSKARTPAESNVKKVEEPIRPSVLSSSPVKPDRSAKIEDVSNFYLKPGTKPPAEPSDGGGSSSSSSSGSDSSSASDSDSEASTYRRESNYTRSEPTDSAFGDSDAESDSSSRKRRRKRRRGYDSSSSSSSSDDESPKKGDKREGGSKETPRMAVGRRDVTKRYRFVKREPVDNEPRKRDYRPDSARIIPKDTSRPGGRDGGGNGNIRSYPKPSQGAKPPVPQARSVSAE
ncbi:hypothetical protein R3P38DRAFT_2806050 [Favolaschia claudopus]|uniref:Uncharacterized protein n=1 Tax=Favolaschia claudopus TaxID=2862362 RepID=A0AAV9ZL90_9AGAR